MKAIKSITEGMFPTCTYKSNVIIKCSSNRSIGWLSKEKINRIFNIM